MMNPEMMPSVNMKREESVQKVARILQIAAELRDLSTAVLESLAQFLDGAAKNTQQYIQSSEEVVENVTLSRRLSEMASEEAMLQNYNQIEIIKEYMSEIQRIINAPISMGYGQEVKLDDFKDD